MRFHPQHRNTGQCANTVKQYTSRKILSHAIPGGAKPKSGGAYHPLQLHHRTATEAI